MAIAPEGVCASSRCLCLLGRQFEDVILRDIEGESQALQGLLGDAATEERKAELREFYLIRDAPPPPPPQ